MTCIWTNLCFHAGFMLKSFKKFFYCAKCLLKVLQQVERRELQWSLGMAMEILEKPMVRNPFLPFNYRFVSRNRHEAHSKCKTTNQSRDYY